MLNQLTQVTACPKQQSWLNTPGSLTLRLKGICTDLRVVVLSEKLEVALPEEVNALNLASNELAWVRCVLLQCAAQPLAQNWVYARTVIPNFNAQNPWHSLQTLGNKPLGEVLFELDNIERTPFSFAKQTSTTLPYLPSHILAKGLLRRSTFTQNTAPLLLTEVFLPDLLNIT